MKEIITSFMNHYQASYNLVLTEDVDPTRAEELHPSGFPYCGLRHAYEQLKWGTPTDRSMDLNGIYYTTIGIAVHKIMQNWLGKAHMEKKLAGSVLGNWFCPKCDEITAFAVTYTDCPVCGTETEYSELAVEFGLHTRGHVDGVYQIRRKNYLFDYKTTSTHGVREHKAKGKRFPYSGNRKQVEAYSVLVEQQYGIEISGWMLAYLARDNPRYFYVVVGEALTAEKKQIILQRLQRYDRHFSLVRNLNKNNLMTLMREKPCKRDTYYWQHMHDVFNHCPLSEQNKCWSDSAERNMLRLLERSTEK